MANMIKWVVTNSTAYAAIETKENNALYFLQDTGELFKGTKSFTESTILVDEFPAKGAVGKIYVSNSTLEGKVWTGTAWKTVILPVAKTLVEGTACPTAASGDAVKAYVAAKFTEGVTGKFVEGITFDKATKEIRYTKNGATQNVPIDGFVTGAAYDGATGKLTFQVEGGTAIDINIPKDNFVSGGSYDTKTQEIVLSLTQGGEVRIPAHDLIDVYTATDTNTVNTVVGAGNVISANVKLSATGGNQIVAKPDGLFVQPTDVSGKMNKVAASRAGEIMVAKADGHAEITGLKAGAGTLAATPNATTLATEAAVSAIKSALEGSIGAKFDKSNVKTAPAANAAAASDAHVLSEKATLTKIEAVDNKKIDKTSITTSVNEASASNDKVVSESALVAALSWTVVN